MHWRPLIGDGGIVSARVQLARVLCFCVVRVVRSTHVELGVLRLDASRISGYNRRGGGLRAILRREKNVAAPRIPSSTVDEGGLRTSRFPTMSRKVPSTCFVAHFPSRSPRQHGIWMVIWNVHARRDVSVLTKGALSSHGHRLCLPHQER